MPNWIRTAGIVGALLVAVSPASAIDRHVYLDTDGDGILNDCPNPAHNSKGTSNTDNLSYCKGGTIDGKIIGTAAGRTTASACTGGGGVVTPVKNGVLADVDGDGIKEPLYGHPQACVWNMAKSDSCEIHAGVYRKSGAVCPNNCGDPHNGGGTLDTCEEYDCFFASVLAYGSGPNLNGTGYGTASAPGYLRGAFMNGSVDSWDPNSDKNPGDGVYPAVLSGDRNGDGTFNATTCSGGSCSGDAFYMVQVGCGGVGGGGYGSILCDTTLDPGQVNPRIDSDGDGTFDADAGIGGVKSVDYLVIKDLEFRGYNGGVAGASTGARYNDGAITLNADGDGDGIKVDHIYVHDNDYSMSPGEYQWGMISDHRNKGCDDFTEIKNSFLVQNNEKLYVNDCGPGDECGCPLNFHDNRVLVEINSPRSRQDFIRFGYFKPVQTFAGRPKQFRVWNNELIYKTPNHGQNGGYFLDLQLYGTAGQLWFYGNLVREHASESGTPFAWWDGFCALTGYTAYFFNNSFDFGKSIGPVCGTAGLLMVEKNNAFLRSSNLYKSTAITVRRGNNLPAVGPEPATSRSLWWTNAGSLVGTHDGLGSYIPKAGGPLRGAGTCDPDGDGTLGVDYNGDGTNDTIWRDIAGNTVNCSTAGAVINIGAIQASGGQADTIPPGDVQNLQRTDKK